VVSKIILFGAGRGATVAHRYFERDSPHEVVGFAVDGSRMSAQQFRGLPLVAFEEVEKHFPPEMFRFHVLLGYQKMNALRTSKFDEAKRKGYVLESYVSSDLHQIDPIEVGENCFILDNQSINLDVRIGNNVVIWSSNHIGDETTIGDNVWISSGITIASNVSIEDNVFIGIGASITNGVRVGARTFVGSNVLVSSETEPDSVQIFGHSNVEFDSRSFMRMMEASGKL
jgi:sugar O-acyltransferase (sialic acid O-acetyltransferase NeuD family)